ncbi:MAG: hypothetical protein C4558_04775 [Dehalococcoidia bacterium]|nr:MAG: hypothetical protein C4558_04775 [Dehalococcoidia bacterium]
MTQIDLTGQPLPAALPLITDAIERAVAGESVDLTTGDETAVKYMVPTAAVRGVKAAFRREPAGGWRVELRPRAPRPTEKEETRGD